MINTEVAKVTYMTVADQTTWYAVGFVYNLNPATGAPEIVVRLNNRTLTWNSDYIVGVSGIQLTVAPEAGLVLTIARNLPLTQDKDFQTGLIDPDQIESAFDRSVMRDQQIHQEVLTIGAMPLDHEERIETLEDSVDGIEDLIPNQATDENQLADKEFVNSSISTATAAFKGTYDSLAELQAITADLNDYGFVVSTDLAGNTVYSRYKYDGTAWAFEYNLNNSSFTAEQWAAINSGITAGIVDTFNATGHNVGDIFLTMRNNNELNGAVECDGTTYNTTDFTGGDSIGAQLAAGHVPYMSLSDYADEITTKGWCDKFGWDGTGTTEFKVPTLPKSVVGIDYLKVSTNGTATFTAPGEQQATLYKLRVSTADGYKYTLTTVGNITDSATYRGDVEVTENNNWRANLGDARATNLRYMVQLAVAATDEALETCTNVLTDVAGLKAHEVIEFQAPTAANNYTWYRKYADGWVEQGGIVDNGSSTTTWSSAVIFPVEMSDANYSYQVTPKLESFNTNGGAMGTIYQNTATGFTIEVTSKYTNTGNTQYASWRVEGMYAQQN